ncbi:MAG: glycine betaine ABC transporter substrate-binding protein [Actinomycetota bacterium]
MTPSAARRPSLLRLLAVAMILLAGCVRQPAAPTSDTVLHDDAITIASFNFPESETLADVYAIALGRAGYHVDLQLNLGARELVDPALERGLVEFVPEYAGTALAFVSGETERASDPATTHERLRAAFSPRGVDVLTPAPGQDQNGVAVTGATAAKYDLQTISDLGPVSPQLVLGGPPECPERPFCLPGLERTYGLRFSDFTSLDSGGPITRAALTGGQIDAGILFTSDGAIDGSNLVLLKDDRSLQPAENITPVVRAELVDRLGPRFVAVVDSVSALLTTHALRSMNEQVATTQTPRAAAAGFLSGWTPPTGSSG